MVDKGLAVPSDYAGLRPLVDKALAVLTALILAPAFPGLGL